MKASTIKNLAGNQESTEYFKWIETIKQNFASHQVKAAVNVNKEMLKFYWQLGHDIVEMKIEENWGTGIIERVSADLISAFPGQKGFSTTNLWYIKKWYLFYSREIGENKKNNLQQQLQLKDAFEKLPQFVGEFTKLPQSVGEIENPLFLVPWGHHRLLVTKCDSVSEAYFYIGKIIENNWSRSVLEYHIEKCLYRHQGNAVTNFNLTLAQPQSDLAQEILKDHYSFDFLNLSEKVKETDLERALVEHITMFLLELGQGFAYMGRQYLLKVGSKEYKTDLLFYHTKMKCYVVIELKAKPFEPEFVGKLSFYTSAINRLVKDEKDNPTIGVLLCRDKDDFEVEISLQDINKPIGVSTYSYNKLPEDVKASLSAFDKLKDNLNSLNKKNK